MVPKLVSLSFLIASITTAKLWQDTLPLFLGVFLGDSSRSIFASFISSGPAGMILGGIFAGMLTDSLRPKKILPLTLSMIGILSGALIASFCFTSTVESINYFLHFIDIRMIIIFLRSACIGIAMNAVYVAVADLYKNDNFLPTANSILYVIFFGTIAFLPPLFRSEMFFIILTLITLILPWVCYFLVEKTTESKVNLLLYVKSWATLLSIKDFVASTLVSMICIGGFYSMTYIFKDAQMHGNFMGDLSILQSRGRQATFWVSIIMLIVPNIKIRKNNCSQYMSFGMNIVGFAMIFLSLHYFSVPTKNLQLSQQILFFITCACTGFCQTAAKTSVMSIAQKAGKNMTGSGQSLVTCSNSLIDFIGTLIILRLPYPFASIFYLIFFGIFTITLGFYLYKNTQRINSYIS